MKPVHMAHCLSAHSRLLSPPGQHFNVKLSRLSSCAKAAALLNPQRGITTTALGRGPGRSVNQVDRQDGANTRPLRCRAAWRLIGYRGQSDARLAQLERNVVFRSGGASLRRPQRVSSRPVYPNARFTRSGDIGVSRSRTPVSSATALAIAGATSGVAIWPTPVGWLSVGTTSMNICGTSFSLGT
jgi:hypothetical protein